MKSEIERQIHYITFMWNLKYDTNELIIYKTERSRLKDIENGHEVSRGKLGQHVVAEWGKDRLGVWRRTRQPTPVFLPGKSHGQRSLAGYSPWGHRVRHD